MKKKTAAEEIEDLDFRIFLDNLIKENVQNFNKIVNEYDKLAGIDYVTGLIMELRNELDSDDFEYFKKKITTLT